MKKIKKILCIAAALALLCTPFAGTKAQKSRDAALARNLSTIGAITKELQLYYVDTVPMDSILRMGIDAMLMSLDPYTEFYGPEDRENLEQMTTGEYGGVGSFITEADGWVVFSGPFEDSPSAKAGLRAGDRIMRVDTFDMKGKKSTDVTAKLRGTAGTPVKVTVNRPYVQDSIITVDIVRAKLHTPSVPYFGVVGDGKTGYIRLTQFIETSPTEVKTAIDSLKKTGVENMVLDLRSNGGGLLESAVEILGYFLPKGTEVLKTKGRDSEKTYKTAHTPLLPDMPVAVLIDGGTASASEITAGAIQDLDRGVLIGTQSFGKGLVQSTRQLPYDNLMKFTVAKYYIPSGRLIQALDYSRRNPDGSVARTPDSLTNVYHTRAGREVRDGGGLKPDVQVNWGEMNRLLYNLLRDQWIFNYATKFVAEHPSIPAAEDFEITDEIYEDFKKSINPDKFKYDKVCEEMLKKLRETAKTEGYLNDETTAEFDRLATLLTHDLQKDLDQKREQISEYLGEEIVSRYYYDRGKIIQELKTDTGVKKAVEILSNPTEYAKLLASPDKKAGNASKQKNADKGKKQNSTTKK